MRRQMALLLKDPVPSSEIRLHPALDLALPKHNLVPAPPLTLFHSPYPYRLNLMTPSVAPCPSKIPSPPPIIPSLLTPSDPEAICESAARLLFMNVKWAKNVPAFTSLSLSDRFILLEESWRDLFVIGSAQFLYPLDLRVLVDGTNPRINIQQIEMFESVLTEFTKVRPDYSEYTCLRTIALFKTNFGETSGGCSPSQAELKKLQDLPAVAALQDHSLAVLNEVRYQK